MEPDQVVIVLSVLTQAQTADQAAQENAQRTARVMAELKKVAGVRGSLRTMGYTLYPGQEGSSSGAGPGKAEGYTAANRVEVQLDDLRLAGRIIDGALRAGANSIDEVRFGLKDDAPARRKALQQAAARARAKADALASALGLKVSRVLKAEEGASAIMPIEARTAAMAEESGRIATPIEPGTVEIQASLTLVLEVLPAKG